MSTQSKPRRHPDSAFREVGDEGGLVVLPGRSEVKVLNPVGIKIYSMLDGTNSCEAIIQAIRDDFEVTEEQAAGDLREFLAELESNGMLAGDEKSPAVETGT